MAFNFYEHDWDQRFLLPEDMREWVPEGDLAHFVIDVVKELDLSEFYQAYRSDGWGAVAYDPRMMVALTIYAYCVGERSSRRIEKLCRRDAGFRLIAGNKIPDHSTIARFRNNHEKAALSLFGQVLTICAKAGLVKPDVIAIDGTKIKVVLGQLPQAAITSEYSDTGIRDVELDEPRWFDTHGDGYLLERGSVTVNR